MKSAARPLLAALRREYSAQAAAASKTRVSLPNQSPKVTKLPNGIVVASSETYSPVSRVAVVYNAGSRYEQPGKEGATHALRTLSDLSTEKATGFAITRNIQQTGGNLQCTTSREHIVYSVECTRDELGTAVEFLGAAAAGPAFLDWEVSDNRGRLQFDINQFRESPASLAMEHLHKAVFRNGLGNSLYASPLKLSHLNASYLKQYVADMLVPANMAVVGTGIDHDLLLHYVNVKLGLNKLPSGQPAKKTKAAFHSDEVRIDTSSDIVHAAVVTEGVSLGSKDMLPLAVLQKSLGTGPSIKYSNGASKISQAGAQAVQTPFAASAININYSDAGLFGFYTISHSKDTRQLLKAMVQLFSSATKSGITDADVQRGKNQLKASLLMDLENGQQQLYDMAGQALLTGQILTPSEVTFAIDSITTADVVNVAKKVVNGKPSMVAVGNLVNTPYMDELL